MHYLSFFLFLNFLTLSISFGPYHITPILLRWGSQQQPMLASYSLKICLYYGFGVVIYNFRDFIRWISQIFASPIIWNVCHLLGTVPIFSKA